MRHTPFSAFLALAGVILPFLLWENTLLVYILVLSPLYLAYPSTYIAAGVLATALLWPNVTEHNLLMRATLVVDAAYIMLFAPQPIKYKMTATKVPNNDFVILI